MSAVYKGLCLVYSIIGVAGFILGALIVLTKLFAGEAMPEARIFSLAALIIMPFGIIIGYGIYLIKYSEQIKSQGLGEEYIKKEYLDEYRADNPQRAAIASLVPSASLFTMQFSGFIILLAYGAISLLQHFHVQILP